MCQLALFYRGSLCVLSGGVKAWADSFYLGAGETIQIFQNGIIAAGILIAYQGFLCVEVKKKKKKRLLQGKQAFMPAIIRLTKCI